MKGPQDPDSLASSSHPASHSDRRAFSSRFTSSSLRSVRMKRREGVKDGPGVRRTGNARRIEAGKTVTRAEFSFQICSLACSCPRLFPSLLSTLSGRVPLHRVRRRAERSEGEEMNGMEGTQDQGGEIQIERPFPFTSRSGLTQDGNGRLS